MADNTLFSHNAQENIQCSVSYELMCLLHWLTEHNATQLKSLIKKAMSSGLKKELQNPDSENSLANSCAEDAQLCIVDFFNTLEILLAEVIEEQTMQNNIEKNLIPTLGHIDINGCDNATVASSVEKVVSHIETHPTENPKELLFKEILKNWKPQKKKSLVN